MEMKIHLPDDIKLYDGELRFFFDLMVRKLHLNRHKGFGTDESPISMWTRAHEEMGELHEAIALESQFDVALEAVDVANFAFLTALTALRMDKATFEKERSNGSP